nr:PREDICTED: uncharacterized protein LOC109032830 [Bemisia tabaci]
MLSNTRNNEENVSLIVQLGATHVGCPHESVAVSTIDSCQQNIVSLTGAESQPLLSGDKKHSRSPIVKEEVVASSTAVTSSVSQQLIEVDHFKPLNEISNVAPQTSANLKFKVSQDLKGNNSFHNSAAASAKHKPTFSEMNSSLVMPNELSNLKRKVVTEVNCGSRMKPVDQSLSCKSRSMMHVPIPNQLSVNSKQKLTGEMNIVATPDTYLGIKHRYNVEFSSQEGMNVKQVYYNRQSPHVPNASSKTVSSHMPPPKWHNSSQMLSGNKHSSKGSSRSHFKSYGGVNKSYAANYPTFTNFLQQPKHRVITFNMVKTIPSSRIKACQWKFNDDDLLDGTIEKRPRFHKHLPLDVQCVLQDHNYGAPPPLSPQLPSLMKPSIGVNGMPISNTQIRTTVPNHTPVITASYKVPMGSLSNCKQILNGNVSPRHRPTLQVQLPSQPSALSFNLSSTFNTSKMEESELSSDEDREPEPEGEETETAPEAEDNEDDSVTRCICEFQHDDGYMICCDKCNVWQHVECMSLTRENIPDEYQCERCQPRPVNKQRAIQLQQKKRKQLFNDTTDSDSSISSSSSPVKNPLAKGLLSNMKHVSRIPGRKKIIAAPRRKKEKLIRHPKQRRSYTLTKRNKRDQLGSKEPVASTPHQEKKLTSRRKSGARVSFDGEKSPVEAESTLHSPVERGSVQQLRQWIDSYEEAVTNHYSPELRARILAIKVNGVHSDLKLPTNLPATPKCRTSLLPNGLKILMSSSNLPSNQPLLELMGKYMLVSPPLPGKQVSRTSSAPPPGPHIFHYRLPKDGTEVCVDARTYGNDARFIRRSCKPNVEIRHCIEKGTLHLYLVTICAIDKNTEITLQNLPDIPNVDCPCGGKCASKQNHMSNKNGIIIRRSSLSPPPVKDKSSTPVLTAEEPQPEESSVRRRSILKDERKKRQSPASSVTLETLVNKNETTKKRGRRRTVSESGKVVVPVEKSQPPLAVAEKEPERPLNSPQSDRERIKEEREQPSLTRRNSSVNLRTTRISEQKKEKETKEKTCSTPTAQTPVKCDPSLADSLTTNDPCKMTREERKLAAILKAFDRLEKDQARKQESHHKGSARKDSSDNVDVVPEPRILKSSVQPHTPAVKPSPKKKRGKRRILNRSMSNLQPSPRTRRAMQRRMNTEPETSSDEDDEDVPSKPTTRHASNRHPISPDKNEPSTPIKNESGSSSDTCMTPVTVSNTCLLVAAAVGPLAPGFKFPQTKKPSLNSWTKSHDSAGGDESPPKNTPQGSNGVTGNGNGAGFAKKRWLRQAISEESETPAGGSPFIEQAVGPLKKRRLARESMSSEQSFTPPTTPTHVGSNSLPGFDEDSRMSAHEEMNMDQGATSCDSAINEDGDLSPELIKRNLSPELIQRNKNLEEVKQELFEDEAEEDKEHPIASSPELIKREPEPEPKIEVESDKTEMKLIDRVEQELSNLMGFTDTKPLLFSLETKKEEQPEEVETPPPQEATPAAVRKKLSISEYRQRKGGNAPVKQPMTDKDEEELSVPHSPSSSSSSPPTFPDVEDASAIIAKSLELESTIAQQLDSKKGGKRFVASSTLVEKQRENLTERLKREFGLVLDDDEEQEKNKRKVSEDDEQDKTKKKTLSDPPPALPKLKEPIISMSVPSNFPPVPTTKKTKHGSQPPPPPPPSEPPPLFQPFYYPYSHFPPMPRHPH